MPPARRSSGKPGLSHHHPGGRLSAATAHLVREALGGLTRTQQARVLAAVERVSEESADKASRRIQHNVIAGANELLQMMTASLAARRRWSDLRAVRTFLAHFDIPVDHARMAEDLEKELGREPAERYRDPCG